MPKEQKQRYRVGSWGRKEFAVDSKIEKWLNESDPDHRIYEIFKDDDQIIILMHLRCNYRARRRPLKTKIPAKTKKTATKTKAKATPKTKTKAKPRAKK